YNAITSKWKNRVRLIIGSFCAIIDNVERRNESGSSNLTVYQKALVEYETQYDHPFTLESCWKILKDHAAWKEVEMLNFYSKEKGSKKSKTFETTSWLAQGGFNLNDEACGSEEEIQEERPIGRDGAKKKASSSSSHFATYLLQEEVLLSW
ncbi:glutathione S-transferase T3-like protein, partial [Tanacetum coccineum]